jgi:methylase of polypeptide subunit release factors
MIQHGFQKVYATDINPNAIIGLQEFMGTTKLSRKLKLDFGSFFGKWTNKTELIVFNPPWLPKTHDLASIDAAIFYNETLFVDFFTAAKKRLLPTGKLVIIFSNLAQIAHLATENPIEKELAADGRFQLEKCYKKSVAAASTKTKRTQPLRALEAVELWVLTHK